jgi:hypothetical protein
VQKKCSGIAEFWIQIWNQNECGQLAILFTKQLKKIIKFHTRPYVIGKTPYAQSASVSEQLVSSDNDESFAYGSSFFQGNLQLSYE